MIDKNKSLIKSEKNIFIKFINFVKNLFWKKTTSNKNVDKEFEIKNVMKNKENSYLKLEEEKSLDSSNFDEKEQFFKLYSDVKSHNVKMSELSPSDLIKFNSIIKEEVKLKKKKIINQNEILRILTKEIDEINVKNNV